MWYCVDRLGGCGDRIVKILYLQGKLYAYVDITRLNRNIIFINTILVHIIFVNIGEFIIRNIWENWNDCGTIFIFFIWEEKSPYHNNFSLYLFIYSLKFLWEVTWYCNAFFIGVYRGGSENKNICYIIFNVNINSLIVKTFSYHVFFRREMTLPQKYSIITILKSFILLFIYLFNGTKIASE